MALSKIRESERKEGGKRGCKRLSTEALLDLYCPRNIMWTIAWRDMWHE